MFLGWDHPEGNGITFQHYERHKIYNQPYLELNDGTLPRQACISGDPMKVNYQGHLNLNLKVN